MDSLFHNVSIIFLKVSFPLALFQSSHIIKTYLHVTIEQLFPRQSADIACVYHSKVVGLGLMCRHVLEYYHLFGYQQQLTSLGTEEPSHSGCYLSFLIIVFHAFIAFKLSIS